MTHNPAIRVYCQQVGNILEIPRKHKRRLLDGLEQELEERFPVETGLTLEDIFQGVGVPEKTAADLMEYVDENERIQYQSRQKLRIRTAMTVLIITLIAVILFSTAYYSYLVWHSVDRAEIRIIQDNSK